MKKNLFCIPSRWSTQGIVTKEKIEYAKYPFLRNKRNENWKYLRIESRVVKLNRSRLSKAYAPAFRPKADVGLEDEDKLSGVCRASAAIKLDKSR